MDTDNDGIADNDDIDIDGDNIFDDPSVNTFVRDHFTVIEVLDYELDMDVKPDIATAYTEKDEVLVYSVDYQLPLIESERFNLIHYGEIAKIDGYGTGMIFPGFSSKFFIFDARLEFRNFGDQFLPGYFDRQYDQQRAQVRHIISDGNGNQIWYLTTKEETLKDVELS